MVNQRYWKEIKVTIQFLKSILLNISILHRHSAEFPWVCELTRGCYHSSFHLNGAFFFIFIQSVTESWNYVEWTRKVWEHDCWKIVKIVLDDLVFSFFLLLCSTGEGSLVIIFGFSLLSIRIPVLFFYSKMNWRSQSDSHNTEFGTEIMWLVIMSTFS